MNIVSASSIAYNNHLTTTPTADSKEGRCSRSFCLRDSDTDASTTSPSFSITPPFQTDASYSSRAQHHFNYCTSAVGIMNTLQNDCDHDVFATVRAMRQQEISAYMKRDPLRQQLDENIPMHSTEDEHYTSRLIDIDELCRTKMCQWSYQIVDYCKFNRESVNIAMNYLDRFLCTSVGREALYDRNAYQLASMTCLYSAIKIHERQALSPVVVSQLSRDIYSAEQIKQMEVTILHALNWQLHPPTISSFVRETLSGISNLYNISQTSIQYETILELAQKQTEYAVCDYQFIEIPSSIIAYCCIINAMECSNMIATNVLKHMNATIRSVLGLDDMDSVVEDITTVILNTQMLLSTVCPKPQILNDDSQQLEYSTSTMDDEMIAEESCTTTAMPSTINERKQDATFEISPRSCATTNHHHSSNRSLV